MNDPAIDAGDSERLPNTLNVGFRFKCWRPHGSDGRKVSIFGQVPAIRRMAKLYLPVIRALGTPEAFALGSIRLSVGKYTNREESKTAARLLLRPPTICGRSRGSKRCTSFQRNQVRK